MASDKPRSTDMRQVTGEAWARRQLERLKRGELPKADMNSVEEIRRMRQERSDEIERRSRMTYKPDNR